MKLIFIKKGTITETEKETNIQVDNITLVGECTLYSSRAITETEQGLLLELSAYRNEGAQYALGELVKNKQTNKQTNLRGAFTRECLVMEQGC